MNYLTREVGLSTQNRETTGLPSANLKGLDASRPGVFSSAVANMLTKRKRILIGLVAALLGGVVVLFGCTQQASIPTETGRFRPTAEQEAPTPTEPPPTPSEVMTLDNYPKLFEKEALIVVGENATQIEQEASEAIAKRLEELTGNKPAIRRESELPKSDGGNYNLILIGTSGSNTMLQKVYEITDTTKVTEEYPGKDKGILEILANPWNPDKSLLIVAGSDKTGVRVARTILDQVKRVDEAKLIGDWERLTEMEQAEALGLTPEEFAAFDAAVREHFCEKYPALQDWLDFPILYERKPKLEDKPGLRVIKAYGRFESPSPTVTFGFHNGEIYVISEELEPAGDA
ncbi:MAG: hypothetical protein U9Q76_09515 [candidate division WOR-3 bacterium]|nr:hypothetical protein [candidate division WOR-3 bacterium]